MEKPSRSAKLVSFYIKHMPARANQHWELRRSADYPQQVPLLNLLEIRNNKKTSTHNTDKDTYFDGAHKRVAQATMFFVLFINC